MVLVDFLAALHVALSVWVTAHVLLNKRDVRGATGWIGFAWLAPFAGAVIYSMLGVNRVTRRALRIRRSRPPGLGAHRWTALPPEELDAVGIIARVGEQMTGRPISPGNSLKALCNGDQAYPEIIAAIRGAERSVARGGS